MSFLVLLTPNSPLKIGLAVLCAGVRRVREAEAMNPMTNNLSMKAPRLDAELKNLINRTALEIHRPSQWATAAQLRKDALHQLAAGTAREAVTAWLQIEHDAAVRMQRKE